MLLARDLAHDPDRLLRAYAEEAGHHLDRWLGGRRDSPGDEGSIFARGLLDGAALGGTALAAARADDDHGTLALGGRAVGVEFLANNGFGDAASNPETGNHAGTQGPGPDGRDYAEGSPFGGRGGSDGGASGSAGYSASGGVSGDPEVARGQHRAELAARAAADAAAAAAQASDPATRPAVDPESNASAAGRAWDAAVDAVDPAADATPEAQAQALRGAYNAAVDSLAADGLAGKGALAAPRLDPPSPADGEGAARAYEEGRRAHAEAEARQRGPAGVWDRFTGWAGGLFAPAPGLSLEAQARLHRDVIAPGLANLPPELRAAVLQGRVPGDLAALADELARAGLSEAQVGEIVGRALPGIAAGIKEGIAAELAAAAAGTGRGVDEGLLDRIAGATPAAAMGLRAEIDALRARDPLAADALQAALSDVLDPRAAAIDRARLRAALQAWSDRPLALSARERAELALGFTPAGTALDVRDLVQALRERDWLGVGLRAAGAALGGVGDLLGAIIGGTYRAGRYGQTAIGHVLDGEINQAGRAVGFHHRPGGVDPLNARTTALTAEPDKYGVYKGRIEIWDAANGQWVGKTAESSFFPDSMTADQIAEAIDEALGNALAKGDYNANTGAFEGLTSSGMTINGYYSDGVIRSAFPIHEEDM